MSTRTEGTIHVQENTLNYMRPMEMRGPQLLHSIRILVVDELRLFRESVAGMLEREAFFDVVGMAGSGLEALNCVHELRPDIVIMDVKLSGMDGIEAMRRIKAELPETLVILLTTDISDSAIFAGLMAGASGYLLKDTSSPGLIAAIRAVYAGEQVTAPAIASRVLHMLERRGRESGRGSEKGGELTARERETIILIAKGMVAKEIALMLAISEKTVRNHISSIYRKLGIYDRSQIVIYALKQGLVDV